MKDEKYDGSQNLPVMMYLHGFMSGANGSKHHFTLKYFTGRTISPVGRPALFARLPPELFINKA